MRISSTRVGPARGFTLIEAVVVVAIIGVLAALAFAVARAAARNVRLYQAAGELAVRATGLRSTALAQGTDQLLVVVDAPGNDASQCGWANSASCARYFILSNPLPAWTIATFNPASPGANLGTSPSPGSGVSDIEYLPRGARFYRAPTYRAPPVPFNNVNVFDSAFSGTCADGSSCFAIRFMMNGSVRAELPAGGTQTASGFAFVLASDAELEGAGGDHRGVVVGFPSGIVKSWSYAP